VDFLRTSCYVFLNRPRQFSSKYLSTHRPQLSSYYKLRRVEVGPLLNTSRIDQHLAWYVYEQRTQSAAQLWLSLRNRLHPLTLRLYAILHHVTKYSCLMHVLHTEHRDALRLAVNCVFLISGIQLIQGNIYRQGNAATSIGKVTQQHL
jgi:hypothetical protein